MIIESPVSKLLHDWKNPKPNVGVILQYRLSKAKEGSFWNKPQRIAKAELLCTSKLHSPEAGSTDHSSCRDNLSKVYGGNDSWCSYFVLSGENMLGSVEISIYRTHAYCVTRF